VVLVALGSHLQVQEVVVVPLPVLMAPMVTMVT
jgi:hypothetical protein